MNLAGLKERSPLVTRHCKQCRHWLLLALISACGPLLAAPVYLEREGAVVFEVEDHPGVEDWLLVNDDSGHLGNGYLQWDGSNHYSKANAGKGLLSFRFRVAEAGNYELRMRSRINKGEDKTEHNDCWVRFPTGQNITGEFALNGWTKMYTNQANGWFWQTSTQDNNASSIRRFFEAGEHTLEISGRSNGYAVDRVVLYRYDEQDFSNDTGDALAVSEVGDAGETPTEPPEQETPVEETTDTDQNENAVVVPDPVAFDEATCEKDTLFLPALHEARLNDTVFDRTGSLTLDDTNTQLLLNFDLRAVSGDYIAEWQYTMSDTAGDGSLDVWLGANDGWTVPSSASGEAVQRSVRLAGASGTWKSATRYATALDESLLISDSVTLVATIGQNTDPLSFASASHASLAGSRLMLAGGPGFCTRYESSLAELEAGRDTPTEEPSTAIDGPEPNEPGVDQEVPVVGSEGGSDDLKDGAASTVSAGSLSVLSWLLLLLTGIGRRAMAGRERS